MFFRKLHNILEFGRPGILCCVQHAEFLSLSVFYVETPPPEGGVVTDRSENSNAFLDIFNQYLLTLHINKVFEFIEKVDLKLVEKGQFHDEPKNWQFFGHNNGKWLNDYLNSTDTIIKLQCLSFKRK